MLVATADNYIKSNVNFMRTFNLSAQKFTVVKFFIRSYSFMAKMIVPGALKRLFHQIYSNIRKLLNLRFI